MFLADRFVIPYLQLLLLSKLGNYDQVFYSSITLYILPFILMVAGVVLFVLGKKKNGQLGDYLNLHDYSKRPDFMKSPGKTWQYSILINNDDENSDYRHDNRLELLGLPMCL